MPRSFLVKKVKLDDFSSTDLESSYGRSRTDLNLRFHEKGKLICFSRHYESFLKLSLPEFNAVLPVFQTMLPQRASF